MRTIILLAVATVVQILAAGAIGAERYKIETGKIRKKYSEFAFKLATLTISGLTFFLLYGFITGEVFAFKIPVEVINGFSMILVATLMIGASAVILMLLNDSNEKNMLGFFFIIILLIIFIAELMILGIESQLNTDVAILISSIGGVVLYGEFLYRVTIIGGNLRIIKLEKILETSD